MGLSGDLSPADIQAVTGGNDMFGGNGSWWVILFLFAMFGGWGGYGNRGGGIADNYVLASDFATIQRQLSDGFGGIDNALDRQNAGICDLGYTQLSLNNQTNMAMMQGLNSVQAQIADCCCTNRYDALVNTNNLQNAINTGFCQTNFNNQNNTRDIIENQNSNARAILDALQAQTIAAKDEKIAEQNQQIFNLQLAASQAAQNAYLVNQLKPQLPIAAYTVPNPFNGCGCGC